MSKRLQLADLHFSDKPNDQFMWAIVEQVIDLIKTHNITAIDLLGDILHEKEGHKSDLLNKVVKALCAWAAEVDELYIVHGNHDSIWSVTPYLKFMEEFDNIFYVNEPLEVADKPHNRLYLPHTNTPSKDWENLDFTDKIVFAHVGVNGCLSETGFKLESPVEASIFDKSVMCLAGDIHKHQVVGKVEYIGSPYATHFGDNNFEGRGLILDTEKLTKTPVYFDFPKRLTFEVDSVEAFEKLQSKHAATGDQIKIKLNINLSNAENKRQIEHDLKEAIVKSGCTWAGTQRILNPEMTPDKTKRTARSNKNQFLNYDQYCRVNNIEGELKQRGLDLIEKAKKL